jgi:hypothetical protein
MTETGQSDIDAVAFVKGWISGWLEGGGKLDKTVAAKALAALERHREFGSVTLGEPWQKRLEEAIAEAQR